MQEIEISQMPIKPLPHDLDAEEAVLGSILVDPNAIGKVDFLADVDFYREKHRWTFEAMGSLLERREGINPITVAYEMSRRQKLDAAGGGEFLSHLITQVPTAVHVAHYAAIVKRLSFYRQLIVTSNQLAAIGYEQPPDTREALNKCHDLLGELKPLGGSRLQTMGDVMPGFFDELLARQSRGNPSALTVGIYDLDAYLGGFYPGDLVIIGGRSSMGKTSLLMQVARGIDAGGRAVLFFSGEQTTVDLLERELARETGLSVKEIREGFYPSEVMERINQGAAELASRRIIWPASSFYVADIRSAAEEAVARYGISALCVDYLQKIMDSGDNMAQRIDRISRELKEIARSLNIVVFCAAQINREPEKRTNKRPQLADFRESGSIENDADVALLLYREDYYTTAEEWAATHPGQAYPKGVAEIQVAKNRQGASGERIRVYFREKSMTFENLSREARQ